MVLVITDRKVILKKDVLNLIKEVVGLSIARIPFSNAHKICFSSQPVSRTYIFIV